MHRGHSYQAALVRIRLAAVHAGGDRELRVGRGRRQRSDRAVLLDPSAASGKAPLKVSLHDRRRDLPKPVTSWTLLYGDGLVEHEDRARCRTSPGHTYSQAVGSYDVLLVAEPPAGRRASSRHTIGAPLAVR